MAPCYVDQPRLQVGDQLRAIAVVDVVTSVAAAIRVVPAGEMQRSLARKLCVEDGDVEWDARRVGARRCYVDYPTKRPGSLARSGASSIQICCVTPGSNATLTGRDASPMSCSSAADQLLNSSPVQLTR